MDCNHISNLLDVRFQMSGLVQRYVCSLDWPTVFTLSFEVSKHISTIVEKAIHNGWQVVPIQVKLADDNHGTTTMAERR